MYSQVEIDCLLSFPEADCTQVLRLAPFSVTFPICPLINLLLPFITKILFAGLFCQVLQCPILKRQKH